MACSLVFPILKRLDGELQLEILISSFYKVNLPVVSTSSFKYDKYQRGLEIKCRNPPIIEFCSNTIIGTPNKAEGKSLEVNGGSEDPKVSLSVSQPPTVHDGKMKDEVFLIKSNTPEQH
ncbi:hypothetical protein GOODEAATRI_027089 [Goodea atripinnis]|uniref:Uncharacterized protein n=1 Tax=Goodea atripinnis TaxID=208336 RepID=A0ABV0MP29_9TELE